MSRRILLILLMVAGLLFFQGQWQIAAAAPPAVAGSQATSGGAEDATSIELVAPSGITAGELLLIIVASDDASSVQQFTDNVSGWSLIGESGNSTIDAHIAAYYRVATEDNEGNVTVTVPLLDNLFGWYIRISGADTASPINVSNFTQATASATDHVVPQVTTLVDDCLAIYGLSFDGGDGYPFSVSGTGWSESGEQQAGTGAANGSGCWGTKTQATAGGTGTATVTCNVSDGAAYFQIAIAPAPQSVTVSGISDATNTITTYDGTEYLLDANATVSMALGKTPSAPFSLWFDVDATPTNGSPSRSAVASGSGTSWSAVIPASDSEIVDGALVQFIANVDGANYSLSGTTPWKYRSATDTTWIQTDWVTGTTALESGTWTNSYSKYNTGSNLSHSTAGEATLSGSAGANIADHVVISEVSPSSTNGEFVELYNPTDSAVNMNGWYLNLYSGDVTFTASHEIPAYGYFLIAETNPFMGLAPDIVQAIGVTDDGASSYAQLRSGGAAGPVVDALGWGTSAIKEGTLATSPGSGKSLERKSGATHDDAKGNGYDTGDNANDFYTRTTPQPQNSGSSTETPPGYDTPGTLDSSVFDAGATGGDWGTMRWTVTTPSETSFSVYVRTDTNSDMSAATAWGSCTAASQGSDISSLGSVTDTNRYIQYRAALSGTTSNTPTFQAIAINYVASAGGNERPSVTIDQVDNDASYSGKWFGNKDIEIDYTLTDTEDDSCDIDIEYSVDSTNGTDGSWTDCTDAGGTSDGKTGLAATSGGTAHDFLWDADGQLSTTEDSVIWVRITPSDAGGAGTTVPSSSFGLDNVAPSTAAISSVTDSDAEIYEDGTLTKIYYNSTPVTASGFTIVVDAADDGSGLDKCNFGTKFDGDGGDDTTEAAAPNVYTSADCGNVYEVEQTSSDTGNITITVYDVIGNTATDTIAVEQDNVAPTATLALDADAADGGYTPNTGYYDDSSANVTVSDAADGGSGLPTNCYKWKKDAGAYGAYGSSNTHNFIELADGDHTLYSMVKDNVNNTWEDSVAVTVDTSNPVGHIDLVETSDGLYISDGTDITAGTLYYKNDTATNSYHFETADADVTWDNSGAWKVVFDAEWGETENEDTATPYASSTYNISISEDPAAGTHWVRLVNNAGNYQEISITLTEDVTGPDPGTVSLGESEDYLYADDGNDKLYYSDQMGASSQSFAASGTGSDAGSGYAQTTYGPDPLFGDTQGTDSGSSWSATWDIIDSDTGTGTLTITGTDNVGNTGTSTFQYIEDTTVPSIDTGEWSEPVASDYLYYPSSSNLYFSDLMGVSSVTARLSGTASDGGAGLWKMTFSSETSLNSSPGEDTSPAEWSGDYTVVEASTAADSPATVTLYDNVGNTATANYNYYEDTTAPTGAGCSSPADNATGESVTPTLTAQTASDSLPISYYFLLDDVSDFSDSNGNQQNSGWQSEDTTWGEASALSSGTDYWWKVNTKDAVGNESDYGTAYKFTTVAKDIRINSVAPSETNDWIEFYVTAGGNFNGYKVYEGATLVKTFPTFDSNPATGDYIVLHEEAGTDETTKSGDYWDLFGMGSLVATDNTITLKDVSDNIKDFVAWANQDGTWGSAHVTAADAAVTAGQWTRIGASTIEFDCGPSEFDATDTIGRDASSTDNNSKYDWSYKDESLDTQGGANGPSTTIQGHGTASISPENATAGSTGTFTITYTNDSLSDNTIRHLITIDVPDGWTAPQTTTATAAGYIVPTSFHATIIIRTSGQKIIVPVRNMTDGASVDIIYGDTQSGANPGAVATVGSTGGTNTFTISSDDTGKNVSELIEGSPGVNVSTETTISITNWRELY